MFVESLDNAFFSLDNPIPPDPPPPTSPLSLPLTLDDDVVLAPLANLCVPTFPPNSDFDFDLYSLRVPSPSKFPLAFSSVDFTTSALASMVSLYNALLDSGCTHHIIRDRSLFSSYRTFPLPFQLALPTVVPSRLWVPGMYLLSIHIVTDMLFSLCVAAFMLLQHLSTFFLWARLLSAVYLACSLLVVLQRFSSLMIILYCLD